MIKPLTSLRFFFAFIVFLSHLGFLEWSQNDFLKKIHKDLLSEGFLGVSFFFILSGFILTYSYKQKLIEGKVSNREFWIARFARIYPLHIFTLFIAIPFVYLAVPTSPSHWMTTLMAHFTLTQSFFPFRDIFYSLNRVSWSISSEAFFYFSFPFLIFGICKKASASFRIIFPLLLISIPVLIFFIPENISYWFFYINPFARIIDFIIGIALYELYIKLKDSVTRLQGSSLEILSVLALALFILNRNNIPHLYRLSCYYWFPMSLVILSFSLNKGPLSSFLSKRVFVFLGEVSFAYYLIHQILINYFSMYYKKYTFWDNDYLNILALALLSLTLSYLMYTFIEVPFNKLIKQRLSAGEQKKYRFLSLLKIRA